MDKKKYFQNLVSSRKSNLSDKEKYNFAKREVDTLFFLLENFFNYEKIKKDDNLRMLDLGCGDKFIQKPFEDLGFNYTGYDIEDLNLENESLPDKDNSVDLVVSLGLIEALKNPSHILAESNRVLKKGGFIYLITPNWKKDYKNFYNNFYHKTPFTPESLETSLKLHNFHSIQTFPGLRCKPKWYYVGKYRFEKAFYLLPFSANNFLNYNEKLIKRDWIPEFFKGHSRSIIAIAKK